MAATPPAAAPAAAASPPPAAAPRTARRAAHDGSVDVVVKRQGDGLALSFPFAVPTPAAVFRRADMLWLVFDTEATIGLAAFESDRSRTIKSATLTRRADVAVVRIKLERPRLVSATTDGPAWTIMIGGEVVEPTRPLAISRNIIGPARSSITIAFDEPRGLHRIDDPEAGDKLMVVTALGPSRGFVKNQDFVEFRALASTHGVVVQPLADDLAPSCPPTRSCSRGQPGSPCRPSPRARRARRMPPISRTCSIRSPGASTARPISPSASRRSSAPPPRRRKPSVRSRAPISPASISPASWRPRPRRCSTWRSPTTRRPPRIRPRWCCARSPISCCGAPSRRSRISPIRSVGNQHDAPLWRALAYARQSKWSDAREGFRSVGMAMGTLPIELQRVIIKDMLRASLEVGDVTGALKELHELETVGVPRELEPTLSVLTGRVAEALGRIEDALRAYQAAADSWDRPIAAQGRLRELLLRRTLGNLTRSDAIAELETLTTVWRGDETEVEAMQLLARLYTEDSRYRDAFRLMRTALAAHPNSELTQRIHDEAAESFDGLFLAGRGDALPAIDALSLFYDFRELTPIGRRGDEMIRRLADRLVAVDLLDQAAELLQHQVDHRLQGAARSQVAARLAVIYLMNRKADRTLATLRTTRSADLSNELRNQRLLLEARALSELGRHDLAFEVVSNIQAREAVRLRADILWAAKRWREAAEQIELLYGERWREFEPLGDAERPDILRAAIGFALAEDAIGLERFREKYAGKMGEGPDRRAFEVVTAPVGGEWRRVPRRRPRHRVDRHARRLPARPARALSGRRRAARRPAAHARPAAGVEPGAEARACDHRQRRAALAGRPHRRAVDGRRAARCGPDVTGRRSARQPHLPRIMPDIARGSRFGQRPASTVRRNRSRWALKASGSSRLMVWPVFGITTSAALMIVRFISSAGSRQGQSSSPVITRVGAVIVFIRSTRSNSEGRRFCTPRIVRAAPGVELRRQLIGELPPAARVLVLELHARGRERIGLRDLGHAGLLDAPSPPPRSPRQTAGACRATRRSRSRRRRASARVPDR